MGLHRPPWFPYFNEDYAHSGYLPAGPTRIPFPAVIYDRGRPFTGARACCEMQLLSLKQRHYPALGSLALPAVFTALMGSVG